MEYLTYSLKNETNFDDYKNFTNVNIYKENEYNIKEYFKVEKVDNYKYILLYLKHHYSITYKIYYSTFALTELPKYGNLTVKYTSHLYYNLTSFNNNDNIYIQILIFDYIEEFAKRLNELDFYVLQKDDIDEYDYYLDRIRCINLNSKRNGNISYTFYYTFKKEYNFLLIDFGYLFSYGLMDFYIKNTKNDEYTIDNNKNKFNKKMVLYIVISCGIVVLIGIFVFVYIFVYRPYKETEKLSDDSEIPLKY
jgi:hypothetical protein